tara:strand:- start:923 stop:2167 length:1245 start_codon:yes stop_codon:yes gene_type:complete
MLKSFTAHLLSEQKNTHMMHLEDQVIYGGVKGARDAILALRSLRDMLSGNSSKSVDVTVKWDGAPAVFAGKDPNDGKFFVAKKGVFNKDPKVYKSHADIDADTSGDLSDKLKAAFDSLKSANITDVIQGDIMFVKSDLKKEKIDGQEYVTFHPNTIVYAVPTGTPAAKEITSAKIGVVWHTTYKGKTFEDMKASYSVNMSQLKGAKAMWAQDATLRDMSGTVTLTKKDTEEVTAALSLAGKIFKRIASTTLKDIEKNEDLAKIIETHNNSYVRKGQRVTNTNKHVESLIKYINDKYGKEIDKRSSAKGKQVQVTKRDDLLKFFSQRNRTNLKLIFDLQNAIVDGKLKLINKLNRLSKMNTFIKKKNGFHVTGVEGYVAIDKLKGGAVKLVDRMEFSTNNFSPDVIKGWDTPSRS